MWHSRPPPSFIANAILNFHFDYWHTSLRAPRSSALGERISRAEPREGEGWSTQSALGAQLFTAQCTGAALRPTSLLKLKVHRLQ